MSFTGIPDDALEFYEGLEADNSKTFWTAHKDVYEKAVREPVRDLCDALAPEFGEVYLFRPYRDVRFAKDKSPYKTHQGATVGPYYLHVDAAGLSVGVGYWHMEPDQIERYRQAVDDEKRGKALSKLVTQVRASGYTVGGDTLKTKPRGYDADHPRIELLRHRSLTGWRELGAPDWLHTPATVDHVATAWRALAPLRTWLEKSVGPSR